MPPLTSHSACTYLRGSGFYPRRLRCLPARLAHRHSLALEPPVHPLQIVHYVTVTGRLPQSPNPSSPPPPVQPAWVPVAWSPQPRGSRLRPKCLPLPSPGPHLSGRPHQSRISISAYVLALWEPHPDFTRHPALSSPTAAPPGTPKAVSLLSPANFHSFPPLLIPGRSCPS